MLKKSLLAGTIIFALAYAVWFFGYLNLGSLDDTARQTYTIMANIKLLIAIALYIAWRVTPDSK